MDVGGALVDRLPEDRVDELDDRRVVRGLAQLGDVGAAEIDASLSPSDTASDTADSSELRRLISASMSTSAATATRQFRPVIICMSSTARTLAGSAIATSRVSGST